MPYRECPYCGAHLDPGEKCDCQKDEEDEDRSHEGTVNIALDSATAIIRDVASVVD